MCAAISNPRRCAQVLLFTDKDSTPPVFEALAANLESQGLVFADVSADQAAALEQFSVDKARTILHHAAWRQLPALYSLLLCRDRRWSLHGHSL